MPTTPSQTFRAVVAAGTDWQRACSDCIAQLNPWPDTATLGFVYASDPLAAALDMIVGSLREATGLQDWVGTGGAGVCASGAEYMDEGALVVLVASVPPGGHCLFDGPGEEAIQLAPEVARWCRAERPALGVVHGDPRLTDVAVTIAGLGASSGAFLVGGLTSAQTNPLQIAGGSTEGGLSGVLLAAGVPVVTGLSQGCSPIGPVHEVTGCQGPWVSSLDGRPALDVLREEVGEVLSRDLNRIGGYIHAALPVTGSDRADYVVRNLIGLDMGREAIAIGDQLRRGDGLMLVRRDAAAAQSDLGRMLEDMMARTEGRSVRGALYHTCVARGPHLFGPDSAELAAIERVLGPVPLAGFFTNGEIFHDRLYGYTGVLTLFL
jgi:small ligand-binding sensory domain FIST